MNWKKTSARAPERPRTKGRRAAALAGGILIVLLILFVAGYEDHVFRTFGRNGMSFVRRPLGKEEVQ